MTPSPASIAILQNSLCGSADGGAMAGDGVIPPPVNQGGPLSQNDRRLDPWLNFLRQVGG